MTNSTRPTRQRASTRASPPVRPLVAALAMLALLLATLVAVPVEASAAAGDDIVVVANRGSGTISVIDVETHAVETVELPGGAEPMYVNHNRQRGIVYVGDRSANSVHVFDDTTFALVESIPVGSGVFHQWYDQASGQLWVVGDIDNTVTVVDGRAQSVVATIQMPADLVARGARPHDVFVKGPDEFVSFVGLADDGVVVRYDTRTLAETGRLVTGGDPHLFVDGSALFVASQDAGSVTRFHARTLEERGSFAVPSAHGIFVSTRGDLLVTNIAGGGVDAVWALDRSLNGDVNIASTAVAVPHNVTVDRNSQAWVTHSGATGDRVSVIDLDSAGRAATTVQVGLNPFGLAFVDR